MLSIRFLRLAALASFLVFAPIFPAHATVPTDPTGRCNVIHAYESVCGNLRTNSCLYRDGFNYSGNPANQAAWDNFYNLCVTNSPYQDRYSHECIEFLSLGSSCTSTVEPLVEYTMVAPTARFEVMPLREQYTVVHTTQTAQFCGLLRETSAKIDAYRTACGEVTPGECAVNGTVESEYASVCGDKKPCQCVNDYHCGPACPEPTLPAPPLPPVPTPGGEPVGGVPGGSGGGGPESPETPGTTGTGGATDSTIALGGENKAPVSLGETEGGTAATGAKGCSLGGAPAAGGEIVFLSLIFGGLGLGLRRRRTQ
jgi:hypothetical protein